MKPVKTKIEYEIKALAEEAIEENRDDREYLLATAVKALIKDNERLYKALSVSRGQWCHSVNKEQCFAAIAEHEKVMGEL